MMIIPLPRFSTPRMALVGQKLPRPRLLDPQSEAREKLLGCGLRSRIRKGDQIAITAGSRGFGGELETLQGVVEAVKSVGAKPFIIPAMGSHGGATAYGQIEVLRRLGITEMSLGAPIRATMETLGLGLSDSGAAAHLDTTAAHADGIIVLGRVKTHPENAQGLASGLLKMMTVGLGKQRGAQEAHRHGLWPSVRAVPQVQFAKSKILFGVAVVENAFREPAQIEVAPGHYEAFLETDQNLLRAAQPLVAKIPFEPLDLLIVDELGKNISGSGMDLNVIGHWRVNGGAHQPDFKRIVVLSLTEPSLGNGLGIGLADFTTQRFVRHYDPWTTYVNLMTATEPEVRNTPEGPLPLALYSDREAIEVALYSALPCQESRVCRIKNTASLERMWVSESLLPAVVNHPDLEVLSEPADLPFNEFGNLF